MATVAVTGGIGAGKSLVASELAKRSVVVFDADILAREVVAAGTPGLARVVELFGPGVVAPDGSLDRETLARRVFGHPEARRGLEAIIHPLVAERSRELITEHVSQHPTVPFVYVVPLLVESGRAAEFHPVVLIEAPRDTRIARLIEHRGMSREEAISRVDAQATDEQRRSVANTIIDAAGSVEQTKAAAAELADELWALWPDQLDELPPHLPTPAQLA